MKIFTYNFKTNNLNDKKALVVSDLHIFKEKDCKILDTIMEMLEKGNYNYLYIAGDIIDATNIFHSKENDEWLNKLYDFFKNAGQILPVFIVYGNHDYQKFTLDKEWIDDSKSFYDFFINRISGYSGIYILKNDTYDLGGGYTISGYSPKYNYALKEDGISKLREDLSFLSKLDPQKYNTLLCHYPSLFLDLKQDDLLKNIDLSIAGHNHNGVTQVRFFPLEKALNLTHQNNRGLMTPEGSINPKDTKILRGSYPLNDRNTLVINPAIKTITGCKGALEKLDNLFYEGASVIYYEGSKNPERILKK